MDSRTLERRPLDSRALALGRRFATVAVFLFALAVGTYVARPFAAGSVAFDSQASVLHFVRILEGRHLEVFISTTPKPLLTVVYGVIYELTHDWRPIAWAGLLAYAAAVALTAKLVRRDLGWLAWAFTAAALAGSIALLYDAGFALSIPWAVLFVAAAGLLGTGRRPHPVSAGVLLLLGVLVRIEVLLLVAAIGLILVARLVAARMSRARRPARREWLILVSLGALPIMAAHDWLLTGDPLFWLSVSARFSIATPLHIQTPLELVQWLVDRYRLVWPMTILALIGLVRLCREQRWTLLVGTIVFGPGMIAFLVYLAARHIYVPPRYTAPIDVAAIVAAAAALSWFARLVLALTRRTLAARGRAPTAGTRVPRIAVSLLAAIALGIAITWPYGFFHRSDRRMITISRTLSLDTARVTPTLLGVLARTPGARELQPGGDPTLLLVPTRVLPRLSLDLDLPLTRIGSINAHPIDPAVPRPAIGQVAFHDGHVDRAAPAIEIESPTPFGDAVAVPLLADRAARIWVVAIESRR
jgi:hypothetical protein